jgi:O-antigen/teichoic acid export membrane protein
VRRSLRARMDENANNVFYSRFMAAMTKGSDMLRRLVARPSELAMRVGFNGIAQIAPIIVVFALTPLLLQRLGLDRFGVWSLALIILSTLILLDGGVSASLARFFAIDAARGDRANSGRLLVGSFVLFTALGLVVSLAAFPIAPIAVAYLNVPSELDGEAVSALRWLPALAALALMAYSAAALLQGNGQFRALAASTVASSGMFAVAIVFLVEPGGHIHALLIATAVRYLALMFGSLALGARNVSIRWPLFPSRVIQRELWRYSSRMQLSAVTGFVNVQMDAVVIAAVLPVRYVGLYSIGLQAASAVRSVPLYVFAPVLTLLTRTFRREGPKGAAREFEGLERRWLPAVLGFGVIAVAAIGFSVPVWLGDSYVLSGVTAAILLAGYVAHVSLTGMRTCYVRAVGSPGLETRYSLVWTIGNALFTIPAALLAGLVGVVGVTAITGVIASVYFVDLCRRREGLPVIVPGRRWWGLATVGATVTIVGELLIVQTDLHGFGALALTGLPAIVGLLVFAVIRRHTLTARLAS